MIFFTLLGWCLEGGAESGLTLTLLAFFIFILEASFQQNYDLLSLLPEVFPFAYFQVRIYLDLHDENR